jgi:hypothetical protein
VASAFEVINSSSELDILRNFSDKERKAIREKMIKAVLSTDMAKH